MKLVGFLVLLLTPLFSQGQSTKITSLKTSSEIINAAIDRAGDFYVVLKSGDIQKYDKNGVALGSYTHDAPPPTLFDPSNAIRLLVYYKKGQQYAWLSPDLSLNPFETIDPSLAIDVSLICPSGDQNIWMLDNADLSLKRVSLRDNSVLNEFSIADQFKENRFTLMREYQNFLFLLDPKTGITVYNSLGRLMRKIPAIGLTSFNFLGEELYYVENAKIKFLDLFTAETRELLLPEPAQFALLTDERMILTTSTHIEVFQYVSN